MRFVTPVVALMALATACGTPVPDSPHGGVIAMEPTTSPSAPQGPDASGPDASPTAGPSPTRVPVPLPESFTNFEDGYQVHYPQGWRVQAVDLSTMIIHPIGTNVTITTQRVAGISLEEYLAVSLEDFEKGLRDSGTSFQNASAIKLEGRDAYRVTGKTPESDVDPAIRFTIVVTLIQDRGYFIAAAARESLAGQHQPALNGILASIMFFDPTLPSLADDYGDSSGTASNVTVGHTLMGKVESLADIDFFSFSAEPATTYEAAVELGTLDDALVILYSDGGACVITGSNGYGGATNPVMRWPIERAGTYFLSVENAYGDATGTYRLSLTTTGEAKTDDHGGGACSATLIEAGTEIVADIEDASDVDWFAFDADAGESYAIFVDPAGLHDSLLTLWDRDAASLLDENDDYGGTLGSRIVWTAEESGTYFLSVENGDFQSSGTYTLGLKAK